MNSLKEPCPSSRRERKIRCRLFLSSIELEICHFHVVVVQGRQRNVQKSFVLPIKPIAFLTFSSSPSSRILKKVQGLECFSYNGTGGICHAEVSLLPLYRVYYCRVAIYRAIRNRLFLK